MAPSFTTWSKSYQGQPAAVAVPADEAEVVAVVRRAVAAGQRVKVVGAGHSFSDIAVTDGVLVRLDRLCQRVSVDKQRGLATFEAGTRLSDLNDALHAEGLALPIVGSITAQSLGGLLATGTHGSSLQHGNLSTLVAGMRLVTGRGEVLTLDEHDPRLLGARLGLGALGVVTQLTLRVVPAFQVEEEQAPMAFDAAVDALPQAARDYEYAKLWWLPHTDRAVIFRGRRSTDAPNYRARQRWIDERVVNAGLFRAVLGLGNAIPATIPALNALVGAVYFRPRTVTGRSDHVLTLAMPPVHRESEWAMPAESAGNVLRQARQAITDLGLRVNFILEARYVKGDDGWMSPAHGRDSVQVGAYIASPHHREAWYAAFSQIARAHDGRPHWGKEASFGWADVRATYPKAGAFIDLARELDPASVFRNAFLDRMLGNG